jgi:hypothetical protein
MGWERRGEERRGGRRGGGNVPQDEERRGSG